ncbi:splicing factor SF3a60 protein [Trifolium repens]|nr:splicing factor SF3a60 protein [Trifolium repens]
MNNRLLSSVFELVLVNYHQIRKYYRKHPVARVVDANDNFEALLKEEPQIENAGPHPIEFDSLVGEKFLCKAFDVAAKPSKQAWQTAGLEQIIQSQLQQHNDITNIIFAICSGTDKELAGLFATVVWIIWNNRNNSIWKDVVESGLCLDFKALQVWEDWFTVQSMMQPRRQHTLQQQQNTVWQKPSYGWFKCNVDAGFHKELNKTSAGWCLHDHLGWFIMAETTWINGNCSIVEGKSIALIEALRAIETLLGEWKSEANIGP